MLNSREMQRIQEMQRISVVGSPGAGKSTFAKRLAEGLGIPLFHLDMIWHKPDRTNVTRDEFDNRLGEILARDRFIIDGNYRRTMERRIAASDTVFFLDLPADVCLESVRGRIGKERDDLPWRESELDPEFEQYIRDFPRDQRGAIYDLIEKYKYGRSIIIFKCRDEVDAYLK